MFRRLLDDSPVISVQNVTTGVTRRHSVHGNVVHPCVITTDKRTSIINERLYATLSITFNNCIRIFLIASHQPLFHICITLPVESAPFFIPSTSFCSLSSWFTSFCAYHLTTVTTFTLITYHCLYLPLQT